MDEHERRSWSRKKTMSPYPVQTDTETIIETAHALIEKDGVENLSLGKLAGEIGIKAPSLYRHIANKEALLHAVIEQTYLNMFQAYDDALAEASDDPIDQLVKLSQAQRNFAHQNPNTYMLAYTTANPELQSNPDMLLEKAMSIQQIMIQVSGEENSLPALRGSLALTHGFISLELNGQFRRGGDLTAQFTEIINAYLRGWQ
jgi:AcrR family transcriptional regulator